MFSMHENRPDRLRSAFLDLTVEENTVDDLQESFKQYEALLIKESKTWWDLEFLKKYLESSMIPRGLRIHKSPTFIYQGDFLEEWQNVLSRASLELIALIIKYEELKLVDLSVDISKVKEKISSHETNENYTSTLDRVKQSIMKLEDDLLAFKKNKYKRDLKDYQLGLVYDWKDRRKNRRSRSQRRGSNKSVSFTQSEPSDVSSDGIYDRPTTSNQPIPPNGYAGADHAGTDPGAGGGAEGSTERGQIKSSKKKRYPLRNKKKM